MTNFVNLTPHTLNLIGADGTTMEIPSSGIARASQKREQVSLVNGVPVNKVTYGDVEGLPAVQPDTIYIVSALTAQAVPDREDVFITDDAVRDENGRIIGCRALAHI